MSNGPHGHRATEVERRQKALPGQMKGGFVKDMGFELRAPPEEQVD